MATTTTRGLPTRLTNYGDESNAGADPENSIDLASGSLPAPYPLPSMVPIFTPDTLGNAYGGGYWGVPFNYTLSNSLLMRDSSSDILSGYVHPLTSSRSLSFPSGDVQYLPGQAVSSTNQDMRTPVIGSPNLVMTYILQEEGNSFLKQPASYETRGWPSGSSHTSGTESISSPIIRPSSNAIASNTDNLVDQTLKDPTPVYRGESGGHGASIVNAFTFFLLIATILLL